jgi:hypothetical protein
LVFPGTLRKLKHESRGRGEPTSATAIGRGGDSCRRAVTWKSPCRGSHATKRAQLTPLVWRGCASSIRWSDKDSRAKFGRLRLYSQVAR